VKKFYILLIALFLVVGATAQSCLPDGIIFNNQAQIDSFQINYPGCTEIIGYVGISFNVNNLIGLNPLTKVDGGITIFYTSLRNLNGLNNLSIVGGDFEIWANDSLRSCSGLDSITKVSGNLSIGRSGYSSVGNPLLSSLAGLESLKTIEGWLLITLNDSLKSIEGLSGLTSVSGSVGIFINASLTSLTGIDNLGVGSISSLNISSNPMLAYCAVKSICDYIASPNGYTYIDGNATGCNSQEEVDSACTYLTIGGINFQGGAKMYPNPTFSAINIETKVKSQLSILNLSGQQLLQQEITVPITTVDISILSSGVYVVKIVGEKEVQVGKFIKQ
jgi:hypothetical protein